MQYLPEARRSIVANYLTGIPPARDCRARGRAMSSRSHPLLLIHVGYQRTGSTWLQKHLFAGENTGFCSPFQKGGDIMDRLVLVHPFEFDAEDHRPYFSNILGKVGASGLIPVVSSERMIGSSICGGFDAMQMAERLHSVFETPRILLVVREQRSLILSLYKTYLRAGGIMPIDDFLDPPEKGRGFIPHFSLGHFRFEKIIKYYDKLFDRENVLVLAYEKFQTDPKGFVGRLCSFCDLDTPDHLQFGRLENSAGNAAYLNVKRRLNPFLRRHPTNSYSNLVIPGGAGFLDASARVIAGVTGRGRKTEAAWRDAVERAVGDRYAAGNRWLEERLGFGLSEYRYY